MFDRRAAVAAALLLALLLAAEAWFAFRPSPSWWAFSNGADLPLPLRIAWLALLPATLAATLLALRLRPRAPGDPLRAGGMPAALLLAAAGAALFLLLRSGAHFMGDGYLVITLLERDGDPLVYRAGWGTMVLHRAFFRALRALGAANGEILSFVLLSAFAGGLALFAALRIGRRFVAALRPDRPAPATAFLLALLFTSGATQLYFGHVETYTSAQFAVLLFVLSGAASLLGGGRRILPVVAFAVAVFLHNATIIALPALAVLLLERREGRTARFLLRAAALSPVLLYLLPPTISQLSLHTAPLAWIDPPQSSFYALLTKAHGLFRVNLFALLAPLPAILLVGTIGGRGAEGDGASRPAERFLRTAAFSLVAFSVVIRPGLGPRDWDLFSFFAPALALWAGARALPLLPARALPAAAVAAWGTGLFLLLPWAGGNAVPSIAAERAFRFAVDDPIHWKEEEPRASVLAGLFWQKGEKERAMRLYRIVTERRPDNRRARANVGIHLWSEKKYEEAMPHLIEAVRIDPTVPAPRYYLGSCMMRLRVGDRGESHFRYILGRDSREPAAARDLGRLLYERRDYAEARRWLRVALDHWPEDADLHGMIGQASFRLGDREEAEDHLRRAYELDPDSPRVRGGER